MFEKLKRMFGSKERERSEYVRKPALDPNAVLINAYCTTTRIPEIEFPHFLNNRRDLSDPELAEHLSGFIHYVRSRGDGEMSRSKYHVIRHIQRVQHHLSFSVQESLLDSVAEWAERANALLFLTDGSVRDTNGQVLVAESDGTADSRAEIPYPVEAWERKARTEAFLATKGIIVPNHLPPLVSEPELRLRTHQEVAGRALALFVVAVRAESFATDNAISFAELQEKFPRAKAYFSPKENEFFGEDSPSSSVNTQFSWRYESLSVLQWALGLSESLSFPSTICDVTAVARIALEKNTEELLQETRLRLGSEILDALDLHYRLHWLIRQAKYEEKPFPPELNEGVILERHYALNWLVRFEDSEWDEVDTPT